MRQGFSDYSLTEKIYVSASSDVYRGTRNSDAQPVILKFLKQDYPTPQEVTRYRQEFEITKSLNVNGVIKALDLESFNKSLVIVLEDFGATSLSILSQQNQRKDNPLSDQKITLFLQLAIKITQILGQIHAAGVIHKDINPSNIVFNPQTKELKLIDFGISSILNKENHTIKHPNVLEGTLPYMSPEQTGRMNRSLDYRTDFYSLGVTFYELLTGQLPFTSEDAMELVHSHLAKQPQSPTEFLADHNRALPTAISSIILKLMAKTAEDRYQSAWGIQADLEECLNQWQASNAIAPFPLATKDISDDLVISQKLYGRDQDIQTLVNAFERVASKPTIDFQLQSPKSPQKQVELIMVTGYSGIGKSTLVQEIYKPVTEKKGYFISGKFDQFQRTIPYSAITSAFQELIKQLLTDSDKVLEKWREKLLTVLGRNAQVIIDVIPEVELILGKQPKVPHLGPTETKNRFNRVFKAFVQAFCSPDHPLVIFLDDLQWADSATLKLIEVVVTDEDTHHLFLIGAYRDNEVSSTHPLTLTMAELKQQGVTIGDIQLTPLAPEQVRQFLAETLQQDQISLQPLADLVMSKTRGNPFFVKQFLKALHDEELLTFDVPQLCWQWDIRQIQTMDITDNVVDLMISTVRKLPSTTQKLIQLAACIGSIFDLETLSIICQHPPEDVFHGLLPAVQSGLLQTLSELDSDLLIQDYRFSHDRIQQASYALIEDGKEKSIHLQIARLLNRNMSEEQRQGRLFEVVDHLNLGRELITDAAEEMALVMLNLEAGQKAKEATAYAAAWKYLSVGMDYLNDSSWTSDYELTAKYFQERSEVEYLNGNYEESESLIKTLIEKEPSVIAKAEKYRLLIVLHTMLSQYDKALEEGFKALHLFGIDLPAEEEMLDVITAEFIESKKNLGDREILSLLHESEMVDLERRTCAQILIDLAFPSFFVNIGLCTFLCVKCTNLFLKYGPIPSAASAYMGYANMLLIGLSKDYKAAYEFGELSMQIIERFDDLANKSRIGMMMANHIIPWAKPIKNTQAVNDDAFKSGLESGDLQYAGYSLNNQLSNQIFEGRNIDWLLSTLPNHMKFVSKPKNMMVTNSLLGRELILLNLSGLTETKTTFQNDQFTESEFLENSHYDGYSLAKYFIFKTQVLYLYSEYELALQALLSAKERIHLMVGLIPEAEFNFYSSLIFTALYPDAKPDTQLEYLSELNKNQENMKLWADTCPENFLHKYLIIKAELARIIDPNLKTVELYDRAISDAAENGFIQNEALANELAAKFWLAKGKEDFAQIYLRRAHYGYQHWGALRKVEELESKYARFFSSANSQEMDIKSTSTIKITANGTEDKASLLDLKTVMKASQALAGEIVLSKLLAKLMITIIENAGAQIGFLILPLFNDGVESDTWVIEAEGLADSDEVKILQSIPIDAIADSSGLTHVSPSIVNYVLRTQQNVVLNNASSQGQFTRDPYIAAKQAQSVLCIPLMNQGNLTGVIYLENNLTTGAFTSERVEILRLLSAQAAVSIENSRLYATLEQKVKDRTKELEIANQKLERLANLDALTQVANRRYFDDYISKQWSLLSRVRQPLSVILLDVDFFKRYNDHYGHQAGDECLVKVALAISQALKRPADLVARYGGEEFVVVLPNTDVAGARTIAADIQMALRKFQLPHAGSDVSEYVTASLGVACQIPNYDAGNTLVRDADDALYEAKGQGRNCFCVSDYGMVQQ